MSSVMRSRSLMAGRGPLRCRRCAWEPNAGDAPLAPPALAFKQPAVGAHQPRRDRQAESEAAWLGLLRIRRSVEALEDALPDVVRDADAGIGHAKPGVLFVEAAVGHDAPAG